MSAVQVDLLAVPVDPSDPRAGVAWVDQLLREWMVARAALAQVEREEHPDVTDRYGRVWSWAGRGDLFLHDGTLAFPRRWIEDLGLPSARVAANPNYAGLCPICRQSSRGDQP